MSSGRYWMARGWQENEVFRNAEFSRRDAWIWLIEHACWARSKIDVHGRTVALKRGQLCWTIRALAKAWRWDRARVERFIFRLKTEAMIETTTETGRTVITVCNYAVYQASPGKTETRSETPNETKVRQERDIKEEGKEGKEGIPPLRPPPIPTEEMTKDVASGRKQKGARLPEDWKLDTSGRAFAGGRGFDNTQIDELAAAFFDYWRGLAGQRAVKRDWPATWRNWVRRDIEFHGSPAGRSVGGHDPRRGGQRPGSIVTAVREVIDQGEEGGEDRPRVRF